MKLRKKKKKKKQNPPNVPDDIVEMRAELQRMAVNGEVPPPVVCFFFLN